MSLGIEISKIPFSLRPLSRLDMVEASLRYMRSRGIRVTTGDVGARWRLNGDWELDLQRRPFPAVNVLGAILLSWQPHARDAEDLDVVAARTLEASPAWVVGLVDGFDGVRSERPPIQRAIYECGIEDGTDLRKKFSSACETCGSRRLYWERVCPSCEEATISAAEGGR